MENFVIDWFESRPVFKEVAVEGIKFPIASLSEEVDELIIASETSAEMLEFAADNGLALNRERISESDKAEDVKLFWSLEEMTAEIKDQVAIEVLKLSNLFDVYSEKLESEQEKIVDGDAELNDSVTLGQLHSDANVAANVA